MATLTLASIYELQGHDDDALKIYNEILENDPSNKEALLSIKRLKAPKIDHDAREDLLKLFVNASTLSDMRNLEEWLCSWNVGGENE